MENNIIIYMTEIQYPCGKGSSCCGPVGQSEEDIIELKNAIEKQPQFKVEIIDVKNKDYFRDQKQIVKMLNIYGLGVLPLVVLDNDVVSMATLNKDEIIDSLMKKVK